MGGWGCTIGAKRKIWTNTGRAQHEDQQLEDTDCFNHYATAAGGTAGDNEDVLPLLLVPAVKELTPGREVGYFFNEQRELTALHLIGSNGEN